MRKAGETVRALGLGLWSRIAPDAGRPDRTGWSTLRVRHAIGLVRDDAGAYVGEGYDPQLHLVARPRAWSTSVAVFEAEIAAGAATLVRPAIYVDRGRGFEEEGRSALAWRDGALLGLIERPDEVRGLRFDPSEGPCVFQLQALGWRAPMAGDEDLAQAVEAASPVDWLARRAVFTGLRLTDLVDIAPDLTTNGLVFTGDDPQVLLEPTPIDAPVARLTFDIAPLGGALFGSRLYVAYDGADFEAAGSIPMARQADGTYAAELVAPRRITALRWDPSDRAGAGRLLSASCQAQAQAQADAEGASPSADAPVDALNAANRARNAQGLNGEVAWSYDYDRWLERHAQSGPSPREAAALADAWAIKPLFSILMPVYEPPEGLLEAALRSILDQSYGRLEICVVDDGSPQADVAGRVAQACGDDPRVKLTIQARNGGIASATNAALRNATGDYVVLVDQDDVLARDALLAIAAAVNQVPQAKVLFSDEDKIAPDGSRQGPYFKSDFNAYLMLGHNMINHLGVYRRDLVDAVGGFRSAFDGSQDYDLALRITERCADDEIVHVPHILYHWRMAPGSVAFSVDAKPYAADAARRAIDEALARRGLPFESIPGRAPGLTALRVKASTPRPALTIVSVAQHCAPAEIIDALRRCLGNDASVDIVVVADTATAVTGGRIVAAPAGAGQSERRNLGIEAAVGEIVCLLDEAALFVDPDSLHLASAFMGADKVGVVGGRILGPAGDVRHFGFHLMASAPALFLSPHRGAASSASGPFGKGQLVQEFSAVSGACLFIDRALHRSLGGFDPALSGAWADIDLCLKARAAGRKVIGHPDILVQGEDPAPAPAGVTERDLMLARWAQPLAADPYYNPNLTAFRDDMSFAEAPRAAYPWLRPD